ncbi:MAG: arsenite efflux transporter metallochaperone ArsD [Planctomycetes bacterium]|nr:arsenite efflux transporter metallochaperone ArsD [Planctomycetota bacterium]
MTTRIRVFDPALCCSTGVCGPSVDDALARFAADLQWLAERGVAVERYNLAQQPGAFAENAVVRERLARGVDVLPLVLVGERIAVEGRYPSRETLAALAGLPIRGDLEESGSTSACCAPRPARESGEKGDTRSGCCG